jgi:hypothetical protein
MTTYGAISPFKLWAARARSQGYLPGDMGFWKAVFDRCLIGIKRTARHFAQQAHEIRGAQSAVASDSMSQPTTPDRLIVPFQGRLPPAAIIQ